MARTPPKRISPEDAAAIAEAGLPLFRRKYSRKLQQTDEGRALMQRLTDDARLAALHDMMLSYGSHGRSFSLHDFALWFLWCSDELGRDAAEKALETFCVGNETKVLAAQWLFGLAVEETILLPDGYEFRPIEEMPESEERERHLRSMRGGHFDEGIRPVCALVRECSVPKLFRHGDKIPFVKELDDVRRRLGILPLLINALDGVACLPGLTTTYCPVNVPCGPFGGGGGGIPHYDVVGMSVEQMVPATAAGLFPLLIAYEARSKDERSWLELILFRLCQAKRHQRMEDKVLDLGIALEMALLGGRGRKGGVTEAFCQRGSALLGGASVAERKRLFAIFETIYDARSSVAHSGTLHRGQDFSIAHKVREGLPEWLAIAGEVVRTLLKGGKPDWKTILAVKK